MFRGKDLTCDFQLIKPGGQVCLLRTVGVNDLNSGQFKFRDTLSHTVILFQSIDVASTAYCRDPQPQKINFNSDSACVSYATRLEDLYSQHEGEMSLPGPFRRGPHGMMKIFSHRLDSFSSPKMRKLGMVDPIGRHEYMTRVFCVLEANTVPVDSVDSTYVCIYKFG